MVLSVVFSPYLTILVPKGYCHLPSDVSEEQNVDEKDQDECQSIQNQEDEEVRMKCPFYLQQETMGPQMVGLFGKPGLKQGAGFSRVSRADYSVAVERR